MDVVKSVSKQAKGKIPIAAGFGISQPAHVSSLLESGADGAIVGSALVEIVGKNLEEPRAASNRLREVVSALKAATLPK